MPEIHELESVFSEDDSVGNLSCSSVEEIKGQGETTPQKKTLKETLKMSLRNLLPIGETGTNRSNDEDASHNRRVSSMMLQKWQSFLQQAEFSKSIFIK